MWFKKNKKIDLSSNNSNVKGSIKNIYGDDYDSLTFATQRIIEVINLLTANKKEEALKLSLNNFKLLEENKENMGYQTFLKDVPIVVNLFAQLNQKQKGREFLQTIIKSYPNDNRVDKWEKLFKKYLQENNE